MASLNLQRSLIPKPPSSLGWQRSSHFFQWIFLWSAHWLHQNFLIIISLSWQRPIGNRKHLIANVGMTCTTALRKTSLPAWDSNFSFYPWIFPHTHSLIKFKLAFWFLPTIAGKPRYFWYSFNSRTPNNTLIVYLVVVKTDLLKKKVVLSLFICCPEAFSYTSRIFLIQFISPNDKIADYHQKKIIVKSWVRSYKVKTLEFYFHELLFWRDLSLL